MPHSVQLLSFACRTLLLACLSTTGVMAAEAANSAADQTSAVFSERASQSLLLGITQAGKRLVTVGDRGHVLLSDDQGKSWQQAQVPSRQLLTAVFFIDDQNGWAVGHDAQILHSADGGLNWTLQYSDPDLEAPLLDVVFLDAQQGFAVGAYGRLMHTLDGGTHWEDISESLDNEDGFHLNAITRLDDGSLFIVGEMGSMFRSADQGENWETLDSPYEGSLFGLLPTGKQGLVVYGLRGHLYRSEDAGDSWQLITLQRPDGGRFELGLADGARLADGSLLIVGHGGALLHSIDQGQSFQVRLREDRLSYAGVAAGADGSWLLIGQNGLHLELSSSRQE